ncbi:MAG: peptidoglycan-binding domain-containing protein [Terriglobales bacterium]
MRSGSPIRRWRHAGLSSLICLACVAIVQPSSATSTTAPAKSAPTPSSSSSKAHTTAKHHATTQTASKTAGLKSSARATGKSHSKKGTKKVTKKRGQQVIDPTRAREIQEALIREHYLDGEPSGAWDSATQAAMQRYQQDRGWQSKTTPDSRALIKLGLGPSHDHLLNPESAMTTSTPTVPAADPKDAVKQAAPEDNSPKQ